MKRRLRSRAVSPDAPPIKLTAAQQRSVRCPRCRAAQGDPCRDQRGRAVSAGHADRRWQARRVLKRELIRGLPREKSLKPEEHAAIAARKAAQHDPANIPRDRTRRVDNG